MNSRNFSEQNLVEGGYTEGDFEFDLTDLSKVILNMLDEEYIRFNYNNQIKLCELTKQEAVSLAQLGKIVFTIKKEYNLTEFNDLCVGHTVFQKA